MTKKSKLKTAAAAPKTKAMAADAEARWRRLAQEEIPAAPPAPPRAAEEPEQDTGTRWPVVINREMLPVRNETKESEIAKHPARQAAWEALQAIVAAHKGHEAEDLAHVRDCLEKACPDESHTAVRGVREWARRTPHDLRHLGACIMLPIGPVPVPIERIEDCPTMDPSHLLPPKPLDYLTEYCCASRCYPRGTLDAWSSCLRLPARLRMRRELERRANPDLGKRMGFTTGFVPPVSVRTHHISEETLWGLDHQVYDPASRPLRGDGPSDG